LKLRFRESHYIGEALHEGIQLFGSRDDHRQRRLVVFAILNFELVFVVETGVEQGIGGSDRIVHLVAHEADQLLIRGLFGLPQFFGQLFQDFGDKIHDRDFMVAYFRRHTDEVVRTIPKERLLVYETGQGWEPLCKFLKVPVPAEPYPLVNTREEFLARRAERTKNS